MQYTILNQIMNQSDAIKAAREIIANASFFSSEYGLGDVLVFEEGPFAIVLEVPDDFWVNAALVYPSGRIDYDWGFSTKDDEGERTLFRCVKDEYFDVPFKDRPNDIPNYLTLTLKEHIEDSSFSE